MASPTTSQRCPQPEIPFVASKSVDPRRIWAQHWGDTPTGSQACVGGCAWGRGVVREAHSPSGEGRHVKVYILKSTCILDGIHSTHRKRTPHSALLRILRILNSTVKSTHRKRTPYFSAICKCASASPP
eukprot:353972-Prorocentrum_minimum.AAC.1